MDYPDLSEFVAQLALDSVNVQLLWNKAYELEMESFWFPTATEPWKLELFRGLAPARLSLARFEISVTFLIKVSQDQDYSIGVVPLNLQYARRYAADFEKCSHITITVEQTPLEFHGK